MNCVLFFCFLLFFLCFCVCQFEFHKRVGVSSSRLPTSFFLSVYRSGQANNPPTQWTRLHVWSVLFVCDCCMCVIATETGLSLSARTCNTTWSVLRRLHVQAHCSQQPESKSIGDHFLRSTTVFGERFRAYFTRRWATVSFFDSLCW